jgi:energy-coupling factor transporter ATP-binding protein EcfA2
MSSTNAVRLDALTKAYGEGSATTRALDGVDTQFASGELVAIMGPSGSGKSTMLHVIGALERPTAGVVEVAGRSLADWGDRRARVRRCGGAGGRGRGDAARRSGHGARAGRGRAARPDRLRRDHPNVETLSGDELRQQIDDQVTQQFAFFSAILAIAVIVSILGVVNTLAMSVIERTREIGALRALGASRALVGSSLLDESLLLTSAGAIVGLVAGIVIGLAWIAGLGDLLPGITFHFPVGAAVIVVLGSLAAVAPARRAARVGVIRALTYE